MEGIFHAYYVRSSPEANTWLHADPGLGLFSVLLRSLFRVLDRHDALGRDSYVHRVSRICLRLANILLLTK